MPGKRPKKLASKSKRVKAIARERLGSPKPERILTDRPTRARPKHKKSWQEEVDGSSPR